MPLRDDDAESRAGQRTHDRADACENFLQALAAGLLVGAIYGLMCVGLGTDLRRHARDQLRPGRLHDARHVCGLYFFGAFGVQAALGSTVGPFVAILLAGPVLLRRLRRAQDADRRVSGTRAQVEGDGHFAQLILTLGISLILQSAGLIAFGSILVSVRTPLSSAPGRSARCGAT